MSSLDLIACRVQIQGYHESSRQWMSFLTLRGRRPIVLAAGKTGRAAEGGKARGEAGRNGRCRAAREAAKGQKGRRVTPIGNPDPAVAGSGLRGATKEIRSRKKNRRQPQLAGAGVFFFFRWWCSGIPPPATDLGAGEGAFSNPLIDHRRRFGPGRTPRRRRWPANGIRRNDWTTVSTASTFCCHSARSFRSLGRRDASASASSLRCAL